MRCAEGQVCWRAGVLKGCISGFSVSAHIDTGIYGLTASGAQGLTSCCTGADENRVLTVLTCVSCVENAKPLGADQECQDFSEAAFCPSMKRFLLPEEL